MRNKRIVGLAVAVLVLAGCSSTIEGTGTRAGSGPSATGFPSTSSSGASPTDSPTDPTDSPTSSPTGGDASDLIDQMVDAMTTRSQGFAMKGEFDADGDSAAIDLRMATDSGQGSITIGDNRCDLVNDAGDGYAKAPAAFWSNDFGVDDDVATEIDNKWVEMSGDIEALKTFVDAETFFELLKDSIDDFTLGDPTTKQGVDVQTVEGDDGTTFYIAADEPHLLLELADEDGPLEFTFPDDDLSVSVPSGAIPYPG